MHGPHTSCHSTIVRTLACIIPSMSRIRRLIAADRWPWTWSASLVVWGLTPPARMVAPWTIAAGILATAVAVEIPDRRRRDRLQLAGISAIGTAAVALIGLDVAVIGVVVALAVVAAVVGDRLPAVPHRAPRAERIAARRARTDARHAAADAAEVWS
jgi:hypothetical protein